MPKRRVKKEVHCQYFRWLIGPIEGIYVADGRSNGQLLGRHSLHVRDETAAMKELKELDLLMAVERGLARRSMLNVDSAGLLDLAEGRRLYEDFIRRPPVSGGPRATTAKRYRPVLDKFLRFVAGQKLQYWNQVSSKTFDDYASWLDGEAYSYATAYLELNTLKQVIKFLVQREHLPADAMFSYPMKKPRGTDTYCWTQVEVAAILKQCEEPSLHWLRDVVLMLSRTGVRISELAGLRWSDIDFERGMITLADESTRKVRGTREARSTKSGYSRSFPIHEDLLELLQKKERMGDGRVFHGPLGGKIKPDTTRRILVRDVLTPLGDRFPGEPDQPSFIDGRLHSFRHFFCSECANAGIPERVLMNWLGHRSSSMVHRYFHLHDAESKQHMARLSQKGSSISDSQ